MGEQKKKNFGLDLLRVWLSVEVVIDHYWHQKGLTGAAAFFSAMRNVAVPCFLLMSFYLTAGRFESSDRGWMKTRLARLGGPYLVWPLVYFAAIWIAAALSPAFVDSTTALTELRYYKIDLALDGWDVIRQWLCGLDRRLIHQFWFHHNLIILTAATFLLLNFVRSRRARVYVLSACAMAGFALQYSPLNLLAFGDCEFEVKYSFGRLVATLPYAAIALMIGFERKRIAEAAGPTRIFLALTGLFVLFFFHYSGACPRPKGLGYQGLNLILMALGTVTFFHYLPFDRAPAWLTRTVSLVSRYCMGIYCCHLLVGYFLYAFVFPRIGVGRETFASCAGIWLVSWLLCWLTSLIPGKFSKSMVE